MGSVGQSICCGLFSLKVHLRVEREDNLMWLDVAICRGIENNGCVLERQKDWEISSSAKACNILISLAWYSLSPSLILMDAGSLFSCLCTCEKQMDLRD